MVKREGKLSLKNSGFLVTAFSSIVCISSEENFQEPE
jgi:hypothetical protein